MIRWPDCSKLPERVRRNLERVRGAAAFKELEASTNTWTFENLPWSNDLPFRVNLRNERFEPVEIEFDADGAWWRRRLSEVPRILERYRSRA